MKKVFQDFCNARLYYWNLGLETWNSMYEDYLQNKGDRPSEYLVRNHLVKNRQDWEKLLPSRVLRYAIADLSEAWKHFLNKDTKDWRKPNFHSKKKLRRLGFKLENIKLVDANRLFLTKPRGFKGDWYPIKYRGSKNIKISSDIIGDVSFFIEDSKYYAAFTYECNIKKTKSLTNIEDGIDLNVSRFTDIDGNFQVLTKDMQSKLSKISFYQKCLCKKRIKNREWQSSKSYEKTRIKLNRLYVKVANTQKDLVKKYVNDKLKRYSSITIEDLNVKAMKMGIASKGLHRSLFGFFKEWINYKANEFECELIIADKFYPSTQRCSCCGHIKTGVDKITLHGNKKHGTKHNEYICYECGFKVDRDVNAVRNLISFKHIDWSTVGTQNGNILR